MGGQPAQPSKKRTRGTAPTGTPRGSTFWGTTQTCWRLFLLKHVLALFPVKTPDPLLIGSLYHALLDNWSVEGLHTFGEEYRPHIPLAVKLYEARLKGPPLPKATASEKTRTLPFGMTAKADREELGLGKKRSIRDFKSTAFFSEHDDKQWAVNLGILAEAMGNDAENATVDVICKREGESFGRVQQFEVKVGDREREAVEQLVNDARIEIHSRVDEAHAVLVPDVWPQPPEVQKKLKAAFPKRMPSCVGKYGPCSHYDRCWADGPERHLFEAKPRKGYAWVKDENDVELTRKVEVLAAAFVGVV